MNKLPAFTSLTLDRTAHCPFSGLWLAGKKGMDKNIETRITGYIGTCMRFHSFIPS